MPRPLRDRLIAGDVTAAQAIGLDRAFVYPPARRRVGRRRRSLCSSHGREGGVCAQHQRSLGAARWRGAARIVARSVRGSATSARGCLQAGIRCSAGGQPELPGVPRHLSGIARCSADSAGTCLIRRANTSSRRPTMRECEFVITLLVPAHERQACRHSAIPGPQHNCTETAMRVFAIEPGAHGWTRQLRQHPRPSKIVLFGYRSVRQSERKMSIGWRGRRSGIQCRLFRSLTPPRFLSFRLLMRQRSRDRSNRAVRNAKGN